MTRGVYPSLNFSQSLDLVHEEVAKNGKEISTEKPKKENKFGYQGNVVSSRLHLKEMMQFFQPMLAKCSELMTELVEDEDPYPM